MSNTFDYKDEIEEKLLPKTVSNPDIKEIIAKSTCKLEYTIDNEKKVGK